MRIFLFTIFFISQFAYGQLKYLVSPNDEVIPLKPNERAVNYISSKSGVGLQSSCNGDFIFGYSPDFYPSTSRFGGNHKDVFGQWFIAPADGTIDTLFWSMDEVNNYDSTVSIRIFKSNIFRGQGPGFSPYPPPCLNWGYYLDTNDLDNGITPFRDKATDTNWISTAPIDTQTFDPLGEELWGNGGFQFRVTPLSINALPLNTLGHGLDIKKGDAFFVTMSITSPNYHIPDALEPTRMRAWGSDGPISTTDVNYPSRLWKFYEHDSGPSNCAGVPTYLVKRGWVARGPFEDDTLYTSAYNWWYSMTVTPDYPRFITFGDPLQSGRFEGEPIKFVFAKLCSLDDSLKVGQWFLYYQINNRNWDSVKATLGQDSTFQVLMDPQSTGTQIKWRYKWFDPQGFTCIGSIHLFSVMGLHYKGYILDTNAQYLWTTRDSTYTTVTNFFLKPGSNTAIGNLDEGTSGPIDIGFPFNIYGEIVRYAWIGVNGGITLTSEPFDTMYLNKINSGYADWNIPDYQLPTGEMPKNFIAPFWNNYDLGMIFTPEDTTSFPGIYHNSNDGKFIVEWDIPPFYDRASATFRLILSQSDSSLTFAYKDIYINYSSGQSLIGMQKDSLHWVYIYKGWNPLEFLPQPGSVYKLTPSIVVDVENALYITPIKYSLAQNYPNPFNPSTEIRYEIPVSSRVSIKIFDILGRELATLVDRLESPGVKTVIWNAENNPSGIYFVKMSANTFSVIKKIMLIR
ncbi:MAG: hypothetical protein C0417_03725 [Chlorobiaceae bacterium]|nr:hypothetical protein [Chlorobiaceae bacterium]